jgi:hypothetical protein
LVTLTAAGGNREVDLRIVDKTTNLIVAGTNFSFTMIPAATLHITNITMTDYLTPAFFNQDPDRDWQIQFRAVGLLGAEVITLTRPTVTVFLAHAIMN